MENRLGVHALVWVPGWSEPECDRALEMTREAGYDFIEIPLMDPDRVDARMTHAALERHALSATCSLGLGFDTDVSSPEPETAGRGEALLIRAVQVAGELGSPYLGGVIYSAMGKYLAPCAPGALSQVAACLGRVAARGRELGVTLGLEPVNRYESNLVNTAAQALALIEEAQAPNIVVHLDVYHMNIEEGDLEKPVLRCGDRLGYAHVGESHRGYLGSGTIRFADFFRALARAGYAGPIAFESFSSAVVSPEFCASLAVWRDLWSDGADLARHAHRFMEVELDAARRAVS
jgi:D-psicose/D-tagatose/L-ribulose 3-epimerase